MACICAVPDRISCYNIIGISVWGKPIHAECMLGALPTLRLLYCATKSF